MTKKYTFHLLFWCYTVIEEVISMAVEKRNGKWYIRGKVKLEDGSFKDYHRLAKGCTLKKEAQKFEDNFLAKYNEDLEQMKSSNLTVKELVDLYLSEMAKSKKSSTLATDRYMFDQMEELFDKKINLIRTNTIYDFIDGYDTDEYKISYVNKIRTYLNKLFNFAVKKYLIERNPVSAVPTFKRPDKLEEEMQFYTPDQWKYFSEAFPKDEIMYYTICSTLYYMGMRRGEVLALNRKGDVDMEKRTIRVNKTVSQYVNGQRYIITPPKTKNSYRTIKMPDKEFEIMKQYIAWYDSCPGAPADGFLFGMDLPVIPKLLNKRFHRVADAAGLPRIRIHDLRHSHATLLINHGANIKAISDRLGNTVEEVLKTYAHLFNETEDAMIDIVDKVFK